MPLIDSWDYISTTSTATKTITVPNAIPVGSVIFAAIARGGATPVDAITDVGGNAWTIVDFGAHSNNTFNLCYAFCVVGTAISAGATFILQAASTQNRWAAVFGVFDDVILPVNYESMVDLLSASTPTVDAGPTPDLVVARALVVTAVGFTAAGYPIVHSGNAFAGQIVTTVGSSDRAVALLYKYEGGHPHTGTYLVPSSSTSVALTAAFESVDLPAGTIPYMTEFGEIPGALSYWDGITEHPVVSLEVTAPEI